MGRAFGGWLLRHKLRFIVDSAIVALVLSLPLAATAGRTHTAATPTELDLPEVASAFSAGERAQPVSRSSSIAATRDPRTTVAEGVAPIVEYTLSKDDTLATLSNFFKVSPEAIAFANGITEPKLLNQQGRTIMIPPGEGALYFVKEGDTVESVAARFKVDPKVIMEYNRLYFEPEHFAVGKLVFVRGAALPGLVYETVDEEEAIEVPTVIARPAPAPAPLPARAATGGLSWPVGGRITQYFWAYHFGVDIAAPYGTGLGASARGVVIQAGWFPVGGLGVRIRHPNGIETGYYHMAAVFVGAGQEVARGQIIGTIGMTGVTTGPHVHWEARLNGRHVNPLAY